MDEMANKLSGWKSKPLSYVGRQTLIKAVVSAVPSFVMHTFHLPKVITSRMDSLIRDFFWGFSNNHTRHWYPKAWSAICLPKDDGRLGLRRMGDKNLALIMKLAWSIVKQPSKTWVQLIKQKYLRGKKLLDAQHENQSSSWIWGSIKASIPTLRSGLCYQVGMKSNLHIKEDPWLCKELDFHIPTKATIQCNLFFVHDLMETSEAQWKAGKVNAIFLGEIERKILKTSILNSE